MIFLIVTILTGILFKYKYPSQAPMALFILGIVIHFCNMLNNEMLNASIDWWQNIEAEYILIYILPPLIYYSATLIDIHILRQLWVQLWLINGPILILSIITMALVLWVIESVRFSTALLFGAVTAATDPVAVISILKYQNMSMKIRTLIVGESLLNDGVVNLVFVLLLVQRNNGFDGEFFSKLFYIPLGSIGLGAGLLFCFFRIVRKIYDSDIEIALTIVFCYGGFYLAQELGLSGIFTIVVYGILMAYLGKTGISPSVKKSLGHVWETLDANMNHIMFALSGLIGMRVIDYIDHWPQLLLLFVTTNLSRICFVSLFYKFLIMPKYRIGFKQVMLVGLSNIKGAVTIVLALDLSEAVHNDILLFYGYGIVFLSLIINPIILRIYINYGIKHEYNETVEYILHIREKLQMVGEKTRQKLKDGSPYLHDIQWNEINEKMIQVRNPTRSKNDALELQIMDDTYLEYRVIYLTSLKKSFWDLFDDNLLYRDTIVSLTEIIDTVLDTQGKHWVSCFKPYCSYPKYYWWIPQWFQKIMLYHRINHRHNLLSGYILGHQQTLEHLDNVFEMDCSIVSELKKEADESVKCAKEFLIKLENQYPEISRKIETRQALYRVLKQQQRYLKKIFKEGKINYYIYNHINQEINETLHH